MGMNKIPSNLKIMRLLYLSPTEWCNCAQKILQEETKPEEDNLDGLAPEIAEAVQNIRKIEKSFNIKDFSEGAKAAFEMILNAFAKDERDTLKMLLAKPIYENFIAALDERKSAETKEESTLVAIKSAEITAINLGKTSRTGNG